MYCMYVLREARMGVVSDNTLPRTEKKERMPSTAK